MNCGEEMGLELKTGTGTVWGPNTRAIEPDDTAPVINLHPSFVFSKDELHSPLAFPSIEMGSKLMDALMAHRGRMGQPITLADPASTGRPAVSLSEEWQDLRATWSLTRNGKSVLAERRMAAFMEKGSYSERPAGLADWLFQFAGSVGGAVYAERFEAAFAEVRAASQRPGFQAFANYFGESLSVDHGQRYFELLKAYFAAFGEFSQIHHLVTGGVEIGPDRVAASTHFDATRMFYGNAFEAFASNVETLTALNNLIAGRAYDQLASLSLSDYQKLDKAGRFKAFAANGPFAAICEEADSQLRNASHHGGLHFKRKTNSVAYRAGKGGQGAEREMGYAIYLERCSKLLLQTMVLLRIELLIANQTGARPPV